MAKILWMVFIPVESDRDIAKSRSSVDVCTYLMFTVTLMGLKIITLLLSNQKSFQAISKL